MEDHSASDLVPLYDGMVISFVNYELKVKIESVLNAWARYAWVFCENLFSGGAIVTWYQNDCNLNIEVLKDQA